MRLRDREPPDQLPLDPRALGADFATEPGVGLRRMDLEHESSLTDSDSVLAAAIAFPGGAPHVTSDARFDLHYVESYAYGPIVSVTFPGAHQPWIAEIIAGAPRQLRDCH